MTADVQQSSKEFPCPECAPKIPEERVAILEFGATIRAFGGDPRYEEAMRKDAAHSLVDAILRKGFIQFRKGPIDKFDMHYELTGRLGVVSPSVVSSMEDRISERQDKVAREVVALAAEKIRIWGSYYTGDEGRIGKGQAVDALEGALQMVLRARAE
jgi:hypothetical protein